ncbi:uncharacterized protein LOC119433083 [Dermacentor silvarum]|uniref:uncharacterized protein LOC119433083 n=1 Tax=Dermacentor silvarum TaxID=543639 RepID=UPI00189B7DC0|nr:uncharacterized protein LOC119433083 [Dermacentor silvarum]
MSKGMQVPQHSIRMTLVCRLAAARWLHKPISRTHLLGPRSNWCLLVQDSGGKGMQVPQHSIRVTLVRRHILVAARGRHRPISKTHLLGPRSNGCLLVQDSGGQTGDILTDDSEETPRELTCLSSTPKQNVYTPPLGANRPGYL